MGRRKWDEETIAQALAPVIAELGRMPTRGELAERDLTGVWSAMRRNGGTRVWAERVAALPAAAVAAPRQPLAEPVEDPIAEAMDDEQIRIERIRTRAYFLAMEGAPGGPEEHWLRAERELAV